MHEIETFRSLINYLDVEFRQKLEFGIQNSIVHYCIGGLVFCISGLRYRYQVHSLLLVKGSFDKNNVIGSNRINIKDY